jgi:hypothetical protein
VALGLSREAFGDGGGGIVEILKREDIGDHWQVLTPDGVNDPDMRGGRWRTKDRGEAWDWPRRSNHCVTTY